MTLDIITRAEWGARAPRSVTKTSWDNRTGFMTHYSAANKLQTVRAIQDYHMDTRGWSDIGYNFLVDYRGNAYEGRGWDIVGAHAENNNTANIGVCFIGTDADVTDAGKRTIRELYDEGVRRKGSALAKRYHSMVGNTSCPGDNLRTWVQQGMLVTGDSGMVAWDQSNENTQMADTWRLYGLLSMSPEIKYSVIVNGQTVERVEPNLLAQTLQELAEQNAELRRMVEELVGKIPTLEGTLTVTGDLTVTRP